MDRKGVGPGTPCGVLQINIARAIPVSIDPASLLQAYKHLAPAELYMDCSTSTARLGSVFLRFDGKMSPTKLRRFVKQPLLKLTMASRDLLARSSAFDASLLPQTRLRCFEFTQKDAGLLRAQPFGDLSADVGCQIADLLEAMQPGAAHRVVLARFGRTHNFGRMFVSGMVPSMNARKVRCASLHNPTGRVIPSCERPDPRIERDHDLTGGDQLWKQWGITLGESRRWSWAPVHQIPNAKR